MTKYRAIKKWEWLFLWMFKTHYSDGCYLKQTGRWLPFKKIRTYVVKIEGLDRLERSLNHTQA